MLALIFAITFPSLFVVQKYLGWPAAIAYMFLSGIAVSPLRRRIALMPLFNVGWASVGTIVSVSLVFALAFPVPT